MGLRINQNIAAMNSYRNLSNTDSQMAKSLEKLSSGFRINRAADDAAGLAISEGLRSQVGGLKVASRNAQDGISVVQTAEGALTETHSILQRMRDLSVQSSNDSGDTTTRAAIDSEATALKAELTRIADKTTFNNNALLDGTFTARRSRSANAGQTITDRLNLASSPTVPRAREVDVTRLRRPRPPPPRSPSAASRSPRRPSRPAPTPRRSTTQLNDDNSCQSRFTAKVELGRRPGDPGQGRDPHRRHHRDRHRPRSSAPAPRPRSRLLRAPVASPLLRWASTSLSTCPRRPARARPSRPSTRPSPRSRPLGRTSVRFRTASSTP